MEYIFTYVWMLLLYGFGGWLVGLVISAVKDKKFVWHGLLNGPVCPIYAFVMIALTAAMRPLAALSLPVRIILAVVFGILLSAAFELVTGYILEKVSGRKWWDHSDEKHNFKGYIGCEASAIAGVAAAAVYFLIQPSVEKLIDNAFTSHTGVLVLTLILIVFLIDIIVTLLELTFIVRKVGCAAKLGDAFGKVRAEGESELDALIRIDADGASGEDENGLLRLLAKCKAPLTSNGLVHKRLVSAFPGLKNGTKLPDIESYRKLYADFKEYKRKNP